MKNNIINIVIGKPLAPWWDLCCTLNFSTTEIISEKESTLFTNERIPAKILKDIGAVKSISEVKRNQPKLCEPLTQLDCFWLKWGKKKFWVVVGEESKNVN